MEDKRPKVPDGGDVRRQAATRIIGHKGPAVTACSSSGTRSRAVTTTCPAARASARSGSRWCEPDTVRYRPSMPGGRGVSHQRIGADRHGGASPLTETDGILDGSRLRPWFRCHRRQRLARVIILNRSLGKSALTDSVLQQTPIEPEASRSACSWIHPTAPHGARTAASGPPACTRATRHGSQSDDVGSRDLQAWAVEHGERYRVAYCMHEGDFDDARRMDDRDDGFQRAPRRSQEGKLQWTA